MAQSWAPLGSSGTVSGVGGNPTLIKQKRPLGPEMGSAGAGLMDWPAMVREMEGG